MEEELTKYLKTHEDEVNLRLRFEEKLNNLHALNRVQNQNLNSATKQLEMMTLTHNEMQVHYKQIQGDMA